MYSLNRCWYSRSAFSLRLITPQRQKQSTHARNATLKQVNVSFRDSAFWATVGEFADIDHLIPGQTDHRFRGKLTT